MKERALASAAVSMPARQASKISVQTTLSSLLAAAQTSVQPVDVTPAQLPPSGAAPSLLAAALTSVQPLEVTPAPLPPSGSAPPHEADVAMPCHGTNAATPPREAARATTPRWSDKKRWPKGPLSWVTPDSDRTVRYAPVNESSDADDVPDGESQLSAHSVVSFEQPVAADGNVVVSAMQRAGSTSSIASTTVPSDGASDLAFAFDWNSHVVRIINDADSDGDGDGESTLWNNLIDNWGGSTFSTSCSGIDAPFAAIADLHAAVVAKSPKLAHVQMPRCLFSIEWDKACQEELGLLHKACAASLAQLGGPTTGLHAEACRFGDLASFFDAAVSDHLPTLFQKPEIALDALLPVITANKGVKDHAYCFAHNKVCRLQCATRHIAGTSCTAWSAQGANGGEFDSTVLYFIAWCGLRRLLQEPIVIYENVRSKQLLVVLSLFLADLYHINDVGYLSPCDQAFPCERDRQYVVLRHKVKTAHLVSPLSNFNKRVSRACRSTWHAFFWLHKYNASSAGVVPHELDSDLRWAASRKTVPCARGAVDESNKFLNALTEMELDHLQKYKSRWPANQHVFQLNQDGISRPQLSHGDHMMTLIRNMGICYTEGVSPPRWLAGAEALCLMGFRVAPFCAVPYIQCAFQMQRAERTSRSCRQQAGNAMHVSCVGVALAHSVCNIVMTPNHAPQHIESSLFFDILRLKHGTPTKALL